jgi:hypothetical protein
MPGLGNIFLFPVAGLRSTAPDDRSAYLSNNLDLIELFQYLLEWTARCSQLVFPCPCDLGRIKPGIEETDGGWPRSVRAPRSSGRLEMNQFYCFTLEEDQLLSDLVS